MKTLRLHVILISFLFTVLFAIPAKAFWLLGFSNALTLSPGSISFIGGTGGQLTYIGSPGLYSYTPFLAHAGIRVGVAKRIDWGYRLCTVAMPYSSVGPSLGAETDFKLRITSDSCKWPVSIVAGAAYSYLSFTEQSRNAWAPGAALIISHSLTKRTMLSFSARYVYTGITSAEGGSVKNNLTAIGGSVNVGVRINDYTTIVPEIGVFDFQGSLSGKPLNGIGYQYGVIISAKIK